MLKIVRLFTINIPVQSNKKCGCLLTNVYQFSLSRSAVSFCNYRFYLIDYNCRKNYLDFFCFDNKKTVYRPYFQYSTFIDNDVNLSMTSTSKKRNQKKKTDHKIKKHRKGGSHRSRVEKKRNKEGKKLLKRHSIKTTLSNIDDDLFVLEQQRGILREKLKLFSNEKSKDGNCDENIVNIKTNCLDRNFELFNNFKCFTLESIENAVCNLISGKVNPLVNSNNCKMEGPKSSEINILQDNLNNHENMNEERDDWCNFIRNFSEVASFSSDNSKGNNESINVNAGPNTNSVNEIGNICINNEKDDKMGHCELQTNNDKRERLEEEKFKELREYEYTVRGTGLIDEPWDPQEEKVKFKVVSYNVLSQTLLVDNIGLYRRHDKRYLDWSYRSKLLMKELSKLDADILCLQEVQDDQKVIFFDELTKEGYEGVYKKRTSDKADGCAIYYKTSKFELIDFATVEFFQSGVDVLNRDNIALVVKLHPVGFPKNPIVVSTTHLLYNPRRHDVKLAQMQVLLAEIERFAFKDENAKFKYHPVILTGDFNLEPHTGVYQLLMTGRLHYSVLDKKKLKFAGIRPFPDDTGLPPPFGPPMGNRLLPPNLGITDNCQHVGIVKLREKPLKKIIDHDLLIGIYNSDRNNKPRNCQDCERMPRLFSTGVLWNPSFDFHSVYYHDNDLNEAEATTKHDDWLTVDYIFYTPLKDPKFQHQQLQLVNRMRLPSIKECEKHVKNIPNRICPSDHLPLVATFFLRIPSKPV